jgi:HAD superfamily hydrolase (TIGR01509 family)
MITAIVFDFDGVLADSEVLHLRSYQEVLEPLGVELTRADYFARYLGFDDQGVFRTVSADQQLGLQPAQIDALIARKTEIFDALEAQAQMLFPGAAACVARLAAAFPVGIASGALRHEIESVLNRSGLRHHFAFIVSSGDTPSSKPAPDPYLRAAQLHARPATECVAIEDSRWGLESARAAGLASIGITHTYPRAELASADRVVDSLDEITPELCRGLRPA